jgi:hypothetical protein
VFVLLWVGEVPRETSEIEKNSFEGDGLREKANFFREKHNFFSGFWENFFFLSPQISTTNFSVSSFSLLFAVRVVTPPANQHTQFRHRNKFFEF